MKRRTIRDEPADLAPKMNVVILGLTITSSWGNGHATVYRALMRALTERGHDVLFLEHDKPWYAAHRDLPRPPYGHTRLYRSLADLKRRFEKTVRRADLVIVGSYVPEGVAAGQWAQSIASGLCAFYDIDTPITLANLGRGACEYLTTRMVRRYGLYLSFTGGPTLEVIERQLGSPAARALYCCVDPNLYDPRPTTPTWDLGYMGTYSDDRQPSLERLMLDAARRWPEGRFAVAGPMYPDTIEWPQTVRRIEHLPASRHRSFYNRQRYTLNITRADMIRAGYSPSVRLFEAAACGTPVITDAWTGLEEFFEPEREILISRSAAQTLRYLREVPESQRRQIARRARQRVLREHTAEVRARQLERYVTQRSISGDPLSLCK